MNISELVSMTVASGLPPLELQYKPIRSCRSYGPIAYRTQIAVNSIELGTIMQSEYSLVSDSHEVGVRVSEWGIVHALEEIKRFEEAEKSPAFVSVQCPVNYLKQEDLYNHLKGLIEGAKLSGKIKLCLEFKDALLNGEIEFTRKAVLDLKLLGIQTLVVCSDYETCPIIRLVDIPVDKIILTKRVGSLIADRNKPDVFSSLVTYIKSTDTDVIVEGAKTNDDLRACSRLECFGYIKDEESLPLDEALLLEEEVDY